MIRIKTLIDGWVEVLKKSVFDSHAADEDAHHPKEHSLPSHTDVTVTTPLDVESLIYDEGTSQWINGEARYQFSEANPTGLVNGGELNIYLDTQIEIVAGTGIIIDSYTSPLERPVSQVVTWGLIQEEITAALPIAGSIVYFTVNSVGSLKQYASPPSEVVRRDEIPLGLVIHNGDAWGEVSSPTVINNTAHTTEDYLNQVQGPTFVINGGNIKEAASFTLDQDAGTVWEMNRNWHTDKKDPHREAIPAAIGLQFRYTNHNFTDVGALTSTIEPGWWDNGIAVVSIGGSAKNATIQKIYRDPRDNVWILWGQTIFSSFAEAAASIDSTAVVPSLLQSSVLMGYVVTERTQTTWIIDAAQLIYPSGGGGVGGGGVPITQHYDLSTILVDDHHQQAHPLYGLDADTVPFNQHSDIDTTIPIAVRHVLAHDGDFAPEYRVNWTGQWTTSNAPYERHDAATDNGWLAAANKQTSDRAAPQNTGAPFYSYDGTLTNEDATGKKVLAGTRYTFTQGGYVVGYRVWITAGFLYRIYTVIDPDGIADVSEVSTFLAASDGWAEFNISPTIVLSGTVFDLIMQITAPSDTPVTFAYDWNYQTPQNAGTPGTGEMIHGRSAPSTIYLHEEDDTGASRKTELDNLTAGDTIDAAGITWTIQQIAYAASVYTITVAPASTGSTEGVMLVTFETVVASPITFGREAGYWLSNANVSGMYSLDGEYTAIVPNDDAYGTDINLQAATISPDWDILASSAHAVGGGAGASTFDTLSDTPAEKVGHGTKLVRVNTAEDALDYSDVTVTDGGSIYIPNNVFMFNNFIHYSYGDTGNPAYKGYRANGTVDVPENVVSGNRLAMYKGFGYTGSWTLGGEIIIQASGVISAGVVPTQISFETMNAAGARAQRLLLNPEGQLGIGLTPAYPLDVSGNVNTSGSYLVNGVQHTHSQADITDPNWTVSGADIYRAAGNVGVGISVPLALLHVESTDGGITDSITIGNSDGLGNGGGYGWNLGTTRTGAIRQVNTSGGVYALEFHTWWSGSLQKAMTISAGNVGIGITPAAPHKLDVAGNINTTGSYLINGSPAVMQTNSIQDNTPPSSATDTGTAGDVAYDSDYIYICTATNTWRRTAISTW